VSMSEFPLPPQWAETTLDEIAVIQGGIQKGKKRASDVPLRDVPYLRVANVQRGYLDLDVIQTIKATEDEISQLRLQAGDVLFNEGGDRDKLGRGWIWSGAISECIHQNHVFRARIIDQILDPKLLSWYGNTIGQQYFFNEGKQTTNLASLNSTKLKALPLLVPPQAEQRRIVEVIESYLIRLDDAVATLERVQRNLRRYRASVLKAAVEGKLVPNEAEVARAEGREYEPASVLLERVIVERRRRWEEAEVAKMKAKGKVPKNDKWKEKYVEPAGPDTSELPELPEGWCWATVDQLAIVGTGATPKRGEDRFWKCGEVAWVTSAVVNLPLVTTPTELVTHAALRETNLTVYPPGTVLLAMYGEGKTRGRITTLGIEAATNQALASLELPGAADQLRAWLLLFLEHNYLELRKAASGGVQPNLNLGIVRGIFVPLPPITEQHRIGNEADRTLSIVCTTSNAATSNHKRVVRLRQSILKWAFEGLLVDQNPNDDPASVLLERIRAERAAQPARAARIRRQAPGARGSRR